MLDGKAALQRLADRIRAVLLSVLWSGLLVWLTLLLAALFHPLAAVAWITACVASCLLASRLSEPLRITLVLVGGLLALGAVLYAASTLPPGLWRAGDRLILLRLTTLLPVPLLVLHLPHQADTVRRLWRDGDRAP